MALTDFENVIRHHNFDSGGLDTINARWTDYGPHANHAAYTGTPTIASRGSKDVWAPATDGSTYLEYAAPRGTFSVILPIYTSSTGFQFWYWLANGAYAADDHDAQTNTSANWSTNDTAWFTLNNTAATWGNVAGDPNCTDTITTSQWNVFTLVVDLVNSQMKFQLNDDDPVIDAGASWSNLIGLASELVRLGHVTLSSITGDLGVGSITEIADDVLANQSSRHATEIAALKTLYGI